MRRMQSGEVLWKGELVVWCLEIGSWYSFQDSNAILEHGHIIIALSVSSMVDYTLGCSPAPFELSYAF